MLLCRKSTCISHRDRAASCIMWVKWTVKCECEMFSFWSMLAKCCLKRLFASSSLTVRSSARPHKITLSLLCRDFRNYILAIFTEMYRPVLNYRIPCIEQLDKKSKPKNTRTCKCVKNTVCIVHFHTLTCVCWLNIVSIDQIQVFFFKSDKNNRHLCW